MEQNINHEKLFLSKLSTFEAQSKHSHSRVDSKQNELTTRLKVALHKSIIRTTSLTKKHNIQIQQIFLDILKTKKTLHSKQIKQYYKLFTQNKADSEIFHNTLQDSEHQNIEHFIHIPDARRSLKRLYCRLIQKIMIKLSFYMTNKQKLSFLYNEVRQMMKKCETLIRRLNYMRDLHSINELIQEIYRQNENMQIKIIQQLIDKGFIISIDQFYRINGVDLVDKQLYERIYSDLGYDEDEEPKEEYVFQKLKSIKKFELNINKKSSFQSMIKEEVCDKKKDKKKPVHRSGYIQIQNKYRDLLIHLQNLINNDLIYQVAEEKDSLQSSDPEIKQKGERQSIVGSAGGEIQSQNIVQTDKYLNLENTERVIPNSQTDQNLELKQQRPFQIRKYTKMSSIQSNSKQSSYYCKSEFRQKDVNLSNLQYNQQISDMLNNRGRRPNSIKKNTEYFSKSFINAIKTMQKVNLNDKTNRFAIKRMSEHIFSINKQLEQNSNTVNNLRGNRVNTGIILRRNNEKKSIINLINIYQSRKMQEEIHSMQKQFDGYRDKIIKKDETLISSNQLQKKLSLFYQNKKQLNEISQQKTITNITNYPKILDNKKSYKNISRLNIRKQQIYSNSILKLIPKNLKMQQQLQEEFMKKIEKLKARIKFNTINRIPYFQNARLNHKIQGYEQQLHSSTSTPGKIRKNKMQPNSLLTTKGIETIDYKQFKSLICDKIDKIKMCKTAFVSPNSQPSSKMMRFEVYDRKRRVILK